MFAEVVLSKASKYLDKIYHYSIPEELKEKLQIGHQVLVPFGRRTDIGYVIGFVEKAEVERVKDIIRITSEVPLFSEKQVELAKWIADYYCSFFITALRLVMPPGTRQREVRKKVTKPVSKFVKRQTAGETGALTATESTGFKLTLEQQKAFNEIKFSIDNGKPDKFLLYGITGSGKTEVYLQTIAYLISKGKGAIVMVPEISLTPQLIQRFRDRFQDHIAVLHSDLTDKQRREEWEKVVSGVGRIVLGTRQAVFAPVRDLGLIVIDEEYEITYKSDKSPRYHAREVAFHTGAVVIMGSATPSIETYYKAETGEYKKLVLPRRIDDRPLPPVEVIDMREELKSRNFRVLSRKLSSELKEVLEKGEQAVLFINRRGYFTFVMCRECGLTVECLKCSVPLTYHSSDKKLHCSRCGFLTDAPILCPRCNSSTIKYFGTGTQRIEQEVAEIHPSARILRVDRDTVSKKGTHEVIFQTFSEGKADVLIGTQMVTKGLDLATVTLVGAVAADTGLNLPDFRAAEHTFQLLTQVAGRAGRHHLPGRVVIQTYNPEHYAIQAAAKHDYDAFYRQEIEQRKEVGYPPFLKLVSLLVSGADEKEAVKVSDDLGKLLRKSVPDAVLGPVPAIIPKLRGEWRYRILLKDKDLDRIKAAAFESWEKLGPSAAVKVMIDVEPMSLI